MKSLEFEITAQDVKEHPNFHTERQCPLACKMQSLFKTTTDINVLFSTAYSGDKLIAKIVPPFTPEEFERVRTTGESFKATVTKV